MIEVVRGELADVQAEAVLRPVTAEWTAVTPAMRRLESALGADVIEQCRRMGELPVGSALVTGCGSLPAELMIHVVVRSAVEPVSDAGVGHGLLNGLRRAAEWGIDTLALPPLGTGAGNLDAEEAADLMVPILLEWLRTERHPARIRVVVENDYEYDAFERRLKQAPAVGGAAGLPILDP